MRLRFYTICHIFGFIFNLQIFSLTYYEDIYLSGLSGSVFYILTVNANSEFIYIFPLRILYGSLLFMSKSASQKPLAISIAV